MIQTIKKAWGIPELRKKIIFTALILLIFRIGNAIPVPYVNTDLLSSYLEGMSTKLDVFYAASKLTDDEYKELTELLAEKEAQNAQNNT